MVEETKQQIIFAKVRAAVQILISLGVGIWFIIAYSLYGNKPCDRPVPIFLIVSGAFQLLLSLVSIYTNFCMPKDTCSREGGSTKAGPFLWILVCCLGLIGIFFVVWFIIGQVWTFGIGESQCDWVIYTTSFWYLICVYILLGLGILGLILIRCVAWCRR